VTKRASYTPVALKRKDDGQNPKDASNGAVKTTAASQKLQVKVSRR
jgi:hypothetical protein